LKLVSNKIKTPERLAIFEFMSCFSASVRKKNDCNVSNQKLKKTFLHLLNEKNGIHSVKRDKVSEIRDFTKNYWVR